MARANAFGPLDGYDDTADGVFDFGIGKLSEDP